MPNAAPLSFFDDPSMLAPPRVERIDLGGGAFVLRSPEPLQPYARCIGEWLEHWAALTPGAPAFAEPVPGGGWRTLTWAGLRGQVGAVAQALLDLHLPAGRPLVVLSDNALDALVLGLAGMHIGRAVCTVSSAYCRLANGDFTRIHGILRTLGPALVYASNAAVYGPALAGAGLDAAVVFSQGAGNVPGALGFDALLATQETPAVLAAYRAVTPEHHAKYLLTSGSTGQPKVVINTHRMLCANQQMLAQALPFLAREKPVLLDWLPWSHTFGGNFTTHLVLRHGGTMTIDDGRPLPGAVERTLAHLREVQPTLYFNVPRGFEMLLPALEADDALARHFMGRLRMLFYAGAGMPPSTWQRLQAVARRVRAQGGEPLWMTTAWGSTETSPAVTMAHWRLDRPGVIGLPLPGAEVKFMPGGGKLEMRVRGEHVFPGYRGNSEATREAFDDEGWYRIGDAGVLRDPADPQQGIVFDGRVAEDFKLASGTWVSVGTLRLRAVSAFAPFVQDVVVAGHDRADIGLLVFLTDAGRALAPDSLREHLRHGLQALADAGGGSSQVPRCALVLAGPPDAAAGEITDKGYINQRLVLARRASDVEALYAMPEGQRVVRA
jgi:feruloyl-CoA synthase